jgi:hypothetical protein
VHDAYVPMHAVSLRLIAADKRSMPGLATVVCDGTSYRAAGAGLERVSMRTFGAAPRAMLVGMRVAL